ncbi:MAG: 50S ribosomal protein L13 [Candidatus Midichloria sp.]|nr:50S ribosomal protein L13 [Candidatus Midichloria sp.]
MSYTAGTFFANPSSVEKKWLLIDAKDMVLGRLAAKIARMLRGKHKPYYTPFIDCGDNIVVVNAAQIKLTGKKLEQNKFYWHTGHPGGIKERSFRQIIQGKYPERLLKNTVKRMMPKESSLARKQFKNLYVYAASVHKHEAQQPSLIDVR